jgi:hypothetical protein
LTTSHHLPVRAPFFLRTAPRIPKNPPVAVNIQMVTVTTISLEVSTYYLPQLYAPDTHRAVGGTKSVPAN